MDISETHLEETNRRRHNRGTLAWFCFSAVLLIGLADISGDYPYVFGKEYRQWIPELRTYTSSISMVLIGILALKGILNILTFKNEFRAGLGVRMFLLLLLFSTIYGAASGLLQPDMNFFYVLGDSQNIIIYLSAFAITGMEHRKGWRSLRNLFFAGCGILVLKLIIPILYDLITSGTLDWRYLLKASPYFMSMVLVSLALFTNTSRTESRINYFILFLLGSAGLFFANMRGLFLGTFAGLLFLFGVIIKKIDIRYFRRIILAGIFFILIGGLLALNSQGDIFKTFGSWDSDIYHAGYQYRVRQMGMLMERFFEYPLAGTGLGTYNISYEGYEEGLFRPYLQELEYVNLLAKLGVLGFGMLIFAFGFLFFECLRTAIQMKASEEKGLIVGLTAGLVGLMISTATNTLYSSILFHFYIVIILLSLSLFVPHQQQKDRSNFSTES